MEGLETINGGGSIEGVLFEIRFSHNHDFYYNNNLSEGIQPLFYNDVRAKTKEICEKKV